jgi:AraC family transcriptional regulator
VSRYHLSRVFGIAVGCSPIRYVRGRRLTEAARALANGAPDILGVALEAGYSSHEAFTRAFRDQFTVTPEGLRARGNVDGIQLQEPIRMEQLTLTELDAPRFETFKPLLIAGMSERYRMPDLAGIPSQWQKFAPHLGHIRGQVGSTAYGVICNTDEQGSFLDFGHSDRCAGLFQAAAASPSCCQAILKPRDFSRSGFSAISFLSSVSRSRKEGLLALRRHLGRA